LNYDIHTYWRNTEERDEALKLKQLLIDNNVQTFSLVEVPIGPHPLPMFEAHVSSANLPAIEKTGDHVYDHTKGARFLGEPLELNIEFLRNF